MDSDLPNSILNCKKKVWFVANVSEVPQQVQPRLFLRPRLLMVAGESVDGDDIGGHV